MLCSCFLRPAPVGLDAWGWWMGRERVWAATLAVVVLAGLLRVAPPALASTPTAAGSFGSVAPARLLDTRAGTGAPRAAVTADGTVHLQVTGRGGIPATGVSAVVLNVTVTQPRSAGVITVYADGTSRPMASNLNFLAGQTVPNLVVAPVGADGK